VAFPLALKVLSKFSLRNQYRIADFVSLLVSTIPNRTAKLIEQNIRICFPELDSRAQRQLCRETIKHSCYSAFELAAVWCWSVEKILASTVNANICTDFAESQKSRIIIVPHLGNWEILILWLAAQCDFMCLYKPQVKESVDQFILKARSRNGATMLPVDASGLKQLSRGLKLGKTAMILPDQRPKKDKTRSMSNFFGIPAPTTPMIHNLCKRMDCDVFIATAFRDVNTFRFNITVEALDLNKLTTELQSSLDYLNVAIEKIIRQEPAQYQWGYSRFKPSTYKSL